MQCKTENPGRGEFECLKEGRRVTRCAASVYVDIHPLFVSALHTSGAGSCSAPGVEEETALGGEANQPANWLMRAGSTTLTSTAWKSSASTGSASTTTTTSCGSAGRTSGSSTDASLKTWSASLPLPVPRPPDIIHTYVFLYIYGLLTEPLTHRNSRRQSPTPPKTRSPSTYGLSRSTHTIPSSGIPVSRLLASPWPLHQQRRRVRRHRERFGIRLEEK